MAFHNHLAFSSKTARAQAQNNHWRNETEPALRAGSVLLINASVALDLGERLVEIGDDVVDGLETDREAQEVRRDTG